MGSSPFVTLFKRFFVRLKPNARKEFLLTVAFLSLVAASTVVTVLSALEVRKNELELDRFIANPWNGVFGLYLGDCIDPQGFARFTERLHNRTCCRLTPVVADYPDMATLESESAMIDVQIQLFSQEQAAIRQIIADRNEEKQLFTRPLFFLQKPLMDRLQTEEGDWVLVKVEGLYSGLELYWTVVWVSLSPNNEETV